MKLSTTSSYISIKPIMQSFGVFAVCAAVLFAGACSSGGGNEEPAPVEESAPAEEAPADTTPRAYFIEPSDEARLTSPVTLKFGMDNYIVEPIEDPLVVNPGHGHMHIGVNTECLPPGTIIPSADPWVHFGDGSMEIQMQLPPGDHTLVLQVGDGEHRTLDEPGLCTSVMITVVEE